MKIALIISLAVLTSIGGYSQKKLVTLESQVYKTYDSYLNDTSFSVTCSIWKETSGPTHFLKVKSIRNTRVNVWGLIYEDKTWVRNENKYYELKKDSFGLYFDIYLNEKGNTGVLLGGLAFGLIGTLVASSIQSSNGISNVIVRFRQDTIAKDLIAYEFLNVKPSRVFYYLTKYSKNDTPLKIKIDNETISLNKGSYYEQTLSSRMPYIKQGVCLEEINIPSEVKINPVQSSVILFKRKRSGAIVHENLSPSMIKEFLKNKHKLEKINP